jgi:type IV pilus assembly protein PilB
MSDFPSINDLVKKKPASGAAPAATAPAGAPSSHTPAGTSAGDAFQHKMDEIAVRDKEEQVATQAAQAGLPYIDLTNFPVSSEALRAIPQEVAEKEKAICFYFSNEQARIGALAATPGVEQIRADLAAKQGSNVQVYLISERSYQKIIALYATLPIYKPVTKDVIISEEEMNRYNVGINNLDSLKQAFVNVSITDILTLMVASAIKLGSSDMHVEAEEGGIAVRYRIDGILHDITMLPKEQWKRFISRIKLLAALKLNVTDRPQDGRVTLQLPSGGLDIRVSTLPTIHGESVVMRILHSGSKGVTFDELGLRGDAHDRLKKEIERPNGMIITTGPTGSGKTTTLYAILRTLNKPGVKIITLEDPIEIKMEGINQSQVDPGRDYTFAKGLRSILRQDPDICMVGEIRDLETAEIAIQAALTGHLMLSTIHTNSASGALPRFLSMGVRPFLLAPSLNSVIGQRLVRRICSNCIVEDTPPAEKMEKVKQLLTTLPPAEQKNVDMNNLHFYKGKGCEVCSNIGYKGRIGIYEIFTMNKEIEEIILSGNLSEYTIQEIAVKNGMVTMAQDGLLKALDKITTIDEIFRVTE